MNVSHFPINELTCDFCVVGGGLSGLCAAVAAARRGLSVVLMQDRPMLGGNASSEVRMWVCGAHGENHRETGLIEELLLENYWRNPYKNYSLWDGVLWETAKNEPTLTLLLNCTCLDGVMQNGRLFSVTGWQMTTQTFFTVRATLFADCSGDSVLIPITGAPYRMGRELDRPMSHNIRLGRPASHVPKTLVRSFTLTLIDENGQSETLTVSDHHQRLYRLPVGKRLKKVRFTAHTTHGSEKVHVFAFDVR